MRHYTKNFNNISPSVLYVIHSQYIIYNDTRFEEVTIRGLFLLFSYRLTSLLMLVIYYLRWCPPQGGLAVINFFILMAIPFKQWELWKYLWSNLKYLKFNKLASNFMFKVNICFKRCVYTVVLYFSAIL